MSNWNEQVSNTPKFTGGEVAPSLLASLEWRSIGPFRGGRVVAVAGDPVNPQVFYFGSTGGGVWKTIDGGQYWENILFLNEEVGSHDIALDPHNSRILYAALWRARRFPHMLNSGGEGCGLYKSTDGGETWSDISHNKGLPTGMLGKIGVAISGAK